MARQPRTGLPEFIVVAAALEQAAAERCAELSDRLLARQEQDAAALLTEIADEARKSCQDLRREAGELGAEAVALAEKSLDALTGLVAAPEPPDSASLSLYRALAWVVASEQQAFQIYSYLAAHARDSTAAQRAEAFAMEKLSSAARHRRARRRAFHAERLTGRADVMALAGLVSNPTI